MFKSISNIALAATALGTVAFSAPANACTNTSGQWDCVEVAGYDTTGVMGVVYTGSFTMSHWYTGTIDCDDARATLDMTIDANDDLQVPVAELDASWSSNAWCANASYSSDWVGYDDSSDSDAGIDSTRAPTAVTDPVTGEFRTFVLTYSGTQICNDALPFTFQNDGFGGSSFDFNASISGMLGGNCTIDGTLTHSAIQAY